MQTEATKGIRDTLRELAQHPGGVHSSNPELSRWDSAQIGTQARKLVAKGQLFSAKIGNRHARYFSTAATRDAFLAQVHRSSPIQQRITGRHIETARAPWPADAPARETERTVYTTCPAFVPRFQQHVFPFVHGGLRCA